MLLFKGCKNIELDDYCKKAKKYCGFNPFLRENCQLTCGLCGK